MHHRLYVVYDTLLIYTNLGLLPRRSMVCETDLGYAIQINGMQVVFDVIIISKNYFKQLA
jgi:hypothetical protein